MNSDSKTVRGLSIAIVVLAALGILGVIAGFALIAIFGVAVNDPTVIAEIQNELNGTAYSSGNYFDDDYIYLGGMDSGSILAMLDATVGISAFLLVLGLLCVVVQLIAGVIGIKSCADPTKFSKLFGWTIAGIVVSVLTCSVITLVLFIIVAVYVNKMKKLPPEAFTQQQMGYAGAQPYANQGAYQAPQPGYYQQPYVQPGRTRTRRAHRSSPTANPTANPTSSRTHKARRSRLSRSSKTRKASPSTSSSRPKTPRRTTSNRELGSRTIRQNEKSPHIHAGSSLSRDENGSRLPGTSRVQGFPYCARPLRFQRRPREAPSTRTPSSPNSQDLSRYAFASGEGTT